MLSLDLLITDVRYGITLSGYSTCDISLNGVYIWWNHNNIYNLLTISFGCITRIQIDIHGITFLKLHVSTVSWNTKCVVNTVYPKKYAHGFCFAVLCCGYTLTDFPISIRLTSLALWQSNDCPSASKATLMNMDKYFMWIHYERLRNHNKAKHNKTVCIFLGIYCTYVPDRCKKLWKVITHPSPTTTTIE